jgi:hypothetical protein
VRRTAVLLVGLFALAWSASAAAKPLIRMHVPHAGNLSIVYFELSEHRFRHGAGLHLLLGRADNHGGIPAGVTIVGSLQENKQHTEIIGELVLVNPWVSARHAQAADDNKDDGLPLDINKKGNAPGQLPQPQIKVKHLDEIPNELLREIPQQPYKLRFCPRPYPNGRPRPIYFPPLLHYFDGHKFHRVSSYNAWAAATGHACRQPVDLGTAYSIEEHPLGLPNCVGSWQPAPPPAGRVRYGVRCPPNTTIKSLSLRANRTIAAFDGPTDPVTGTAWACYVFNHGETFPFGDLNCLDTQGGNSVASGTIDVETPPSVCGPPPMQIRVDVTVRYTVDEGGVPVTKELVEQITLTPNC